MPPVTAAVASRAITVMPVGVEAKGCVFSLDEVPEPLSVRGFFVGELAETGDFVVDALAGRRVGFGVDKAVGRGVCREEGAGVGCTVGG